GRTPEDAAGDSRLRKRLRGVIQFLQDCSAENTLKVYDFDRLRQKLGLMGTAVPVASGGQQDISALKAEELSALDACQLSDAGRFESRRQCDRSDARLAEGVAGQTVRGARPRAGAGAEQPRFRRLFPGAARRRQETGRMSNNFEPDAQARGATGRCQSLPSL